MKLNPIEQIKEFILNRFSKASAIVDAPDGENGSWFLDVGLNDYSLVVEWHPLKGISLTSNSTIGYGEGVDEIFADVEETKKRVLELLLSQTETKSPLTLKEIRQEIGLTQVELGNSLNISQASVAKLEKRSNPRLSTLREAVSAMGGSLNIWITFPNGVEREIYLNNRKAKESLPRDTKSSRRVLKRGKTNRNRING